MHVPMASFNHNTKRGWRLPLTTAKTPGSASNSYSNLKAELRILLDCSVSPAMATPNFMPQPPFDCNDTGDSVPSGQTLLYASHFQPCQSVDVLVSLQCT